MLRVHAASTAACLALGAAGSQAPGGVNALCLLPGRTPGQAPGLGLLNAHLGAEGAAWGVLGVPPPPPHPVNGALLQLKG